VDKRDIDSMLALYQVPMRELVVASPRPKR
jgi:hypothetical protein